MKQTHDEIVMWCDENADSIVQAFAPRHLFDWSDEDRADWKKVMGDSVIPPRPAPIAKQKTWERPITDSGKIVGYIDLSIDVYASGVTWDNEQTRSSWPPPKPITGSARVCALRPHDENNRPLRVNIEVKPVIESLGEVIRQIRRYQVYSPGVWVICSPDTRHEKIIKEQRIGFLKPAGSQASLGF